MNTDFLISTRHFLMQKVTLLLICVRILVFSFACLFPFSSEISEKISPLSYQTETTDMGFYIDWTNKNFSSNSNLNDFFEEYTQYLQEGNDSFIIPGPVFPVLLKLFGYSPGMTWPLATLFLLMSIIYGLVWLLWMQKMKAPLWSQYVYSIIPNPIWFTLVLSTDLLFSVIFLGFIFSYIILNNNKGHDWLGMFFLVGCVMCRPNALSLLIFCFLDRLYISRKKTPVSLVLTFGFLCAIAAILYYPYFMFYLKGMSEHLTYFSFTPQEYNEGIFQSLPLWLNKVFSILSLVVAKLLYFVGLRPSYSDMPFFIVFARGWVGLFLLPGIIWFFIKGEKRLKVLVLIFIVPILLGASQDRYNLPVMPIFFTYSIFLLHHFLGRASSSEACIVKED